ncbi:hypothetical protein PENTCL1PPCAC_9734, partial [Pristionchus entomophagus]
HRTSALPLPRESHNERQERLALGVRAREGRGTTNLFIRHHLYVDAIDELLKAGEGRVESIGRGVLSVRIHDGMLGDCDTKCAQEPEDSAI